MIIIVRSAKFEVKKRYPHAPREVPGLQPLGVVTFGLRPWIAIYKRTKIRIVPYGYDDQQSCDLKAYPGTKGGSNEIEHRTGQQDGEVERREVVMQEELPAHQVEREVVQAPADEEESAQGVVFNDFG